MRNYDYFPQILLISLFPILPYFMLNYTVNSLDSAPRVPFKFDGRILFTCETCELIHLTLQPGEGMELHSQPMDVVFFVVEGSGSLAIGEEVLRVAENTTVHVKAGALRGWKNSGTVPLRILVNKYYLEK
ncbi:MAG: cupin domain-containing protein [Bacteroidales bacterium]